MFLKLKPKPNKNTCSNSIYSPPFFSTLIIFEHCFLEVEERSSISLFPFRFDNGVEDKHVVSSLSMLIKDTFKITEYIKNR